MDTDIITKTPPQDKKQPAHVRRPSKASTTPTSSSATTSTDKSKGASKPSLRSKMGKLSTWLATSEPSAQALKQHKKEAFSKAGIPLHDPEREAPSKLHAPIGDIPADAIKPTTGPDPEEVLKKKKKEAERLRRRTDKSFSSGRGGSISSGASFAGSSGGKGSVAAPWEDVPFDGTGWDMLGEGDGDRKG